MKSDKFDRELIHDQYVKVNEAYSVLGKEKERKHYDYQMRIKLKPEEWQHVDKNGKPVNTGSRIMSFEERAKAYGFPEQVNAFWNATKKSEKFFDLLFKINRVSVEGILNIILLQDPDFYKKHGNYHRKVVLACIVWIVFGKWSFEIIILFNFCPESSAWTKLEWTWHPIIWALIGWHSSTTTKQRQSWVWTSLAYL